MRLFLGASLLALASAGSATAQTSAVISEVVVTASRSGSTIQQLPVSASIVDSESVSRQLDISTNVMRALEFTVPGLAPQQNGRSNCVKIRGRMTAVQINGIPVNEDLRQSTCDQVYQLSPFAIERVEVLRGGTALYGAGAPGGIINFVTRQAQSEALEIDVVALTSFNTSDASDTFTTNVYLGAGQKFSGWDYYLGAAYTDGGAARTPGGDYVPGREFEAWSFNGAVGVAIAGGELRATGTYYDETKGDEYATDGGQIAGRRLALVTPIAAHPQSSQNRLRSAAIAVGYTHPAVLGQELAVSVFAQDQLYRQRDNFYTAAIGNDFFASDSDNERFGLRSTLVKRATVSGAELVVSYGFDFTRNRYYRPQIDPSRGGRLVGYIAPETILDTSALFLQSEVGLGRLRLVGGVRKEWYSGEVGSEGYDPTVARVATPGDFGESDLALFNIGAVFDLTPQVQLYGGFSQGAELSQLGRAARGIRNPGLITPEPASADQYEIGARGAAGRLTFEAAAFYSESDRAALLQADPTCAGLSLCTLIPLRAPQRFKGLEGTLGYAATDAVDLRAVATWQRGEIFEAGLGRYVDYSSDIIAPLRITGGVDWRPIEPLQVSVQGTYYGAADFFAPGEVAIGRINTKEVVLFDASASYAIGSGELVLSAANLLDEEYVNVAGQAAGAFAYYRAEGRRVTAGYKARF